MLTIDSLGSFEVPAGKRLIRAILDDANADQHYSCGGQAKCTTCRVVFTSGEPAKITQAELDLIAAGKFAPQAGERLSCQCTVDGDMSIKLQVPKPPAKQPAIPADDIVPPPVWVAK
ncbi:MAG: Na(+)-translocating NADH-quinone reductase subunit [Phycisphaerales bacterium]|nr:Na(+)-translocating NADH-quinone reductase subunit [Phycisphaerales bacterium]